MMSGFDDQYRRAVSVAKLYYYDGLTASEIAKELGFSRPKVSRLLSFARQSGVVEINVHQYDEYLTPLEKQMRDSFNLHSIHIVPVPEGSAEHLRLRRVVRYAANYLNSIVVDGGILGIAWGTTLTMVSDYLVPKKVEGLQIVQMNGSGNTQSINNTYASELIMRFANNYDARPNMLPVPAFFDYVETRDAMWKERSVKHVLDLQQRADIIVYSLGAVNSGMPAQVFSPDYLEQEDLAELGEKNVVGDLATVFYSEDGRYRDIVINERASGPDLRLYRRVPHALCVVSGTPKVTAIHSALRAGYMNELIIDEYTARKVMEREYDGEQEQ